MALYVAINECYDASKLTSLDDVVDHCSAYTTRDGQVITKAIARKMLKEDALRCYSYSGEELEEAQSEGEVLGVDWSLKIVAL